MLFVGGYLRLHALAVPSFWLDEMLGYDIASAAAKAPLWKWVLPFEPEHGPLYHATELAGRFLPTPEGSGRIAPAIFGIATIAVLWVAGRAIDERVAACAAILTALSPAHVYYSREGRPYALLMLLAAATLALLLRGSRKTIVPLVLSLYTSAIAVPFLISTAVAARRRVAVAAIICTIAGFAMYSPSGGVPIPFQVSSLADRVTIATPIFAALLIAGGVWLVKRDREKARTVISLCALPVLITIAALVMRNHWYAFRYITMAFPAAILLAACGITALCPRTPIAILAAFAFALPGVPLALHEPFQKADWRGTAALLRHEVHDWDIVLLTNDWSDHCLGFYLRERPLKVNWINVHESVAKADELTKQADRAWIVVAGHYQNGEIERWAEKFERVKADPLLYFASKQNVFTAGSSPSSRER
jgi:hypothetical protein